MVSTPITAPPTLSMKNTNSSRRACGLRQTSRKAVRGLVPPRPWNSARSSIRVAITSTSTAMAAAATVACQLASPC